jgi:hypothetical protein
MTIKSSSNKNRGFFLQLIYAKSIYKTSVTAIKTMMKSPINSNCPELNPTLKLRPAMDLNILLVESREYSCSRFNGLKNGNKLSAEPERLPVINPALPEKTKKSISETIRT